MKGSLTAWCLLIFITVAPAASAQDVQVTAAVSSDTVGVQDQFQLTIKVSGSEIGDVPPPRLPQFRGFRVVAGPSVSTQFQWINGRSTNSKSFIYILLPEKEGQFRIDPVEVVVGGRACKTEPLEMRVTAGSVNPPSRRPRPLDPFAEPDFDVTRPRSMGDEVFVAAELDRASAFVGQQVTLSYYLFTQVSVTGLQLQENPPLNGFWVEDLQVDSNPTGVHRVLNGKEYVVYLVKKQALFPNTPGKLTIPPSTFAISAKSVGSFLGLFGQAETLYRKTKELGLEVRSLPPSNRPGNFSNAVGSFTLTSSLNKTEVATGDAVTLMIKLAGSGNLKMIPDLAIPPMPDFTIYSSKRVENLRPSGRDQIGGDKTWEYVLIPKVPGPHSFPSLSFSFFNPESSTYQTVTTAPVALDVVRGADTGNLITGLPGTNRQNLTRQGTDINFIKLSGGNLQRAGAPVYRTFWFYVVAAGPVVFNIGVLLYQRKRSRQSLDVVLTRSRRARRKALVRLKRAMKTGRAEPRRFYDEAAAALSGYLEDKFNLPEIALTGDVLERTLTEKSVAPEIVRETVKCLEDCDFGRFVSASPVPEKMAHLADRIRTAVGRLEQS